MKRQWLFQPIVMVIIIFAYIPTTQAVNEPEFVITDGWDFDKIELYDLEYIIHGFSSPSHWPPTRADMTGGSVGEWDDPDSGMFTYESSTFNMSGGTVDYLHTYNSSTVNISGGLVSHYDCWGTQTISSHNSSTINVYDGAFLSGGTFHIFAMYDSSTLNVYGGDVALFLMPYNYSIVNIYNGSCSLGIHPYDYSTVNVYGGYIDFYTDGNVPPTATVNIYGYGFNYNPQAECRHFQGQVCDWWVSKLTGFGPDGTAITYWGLPDPATHANINLIPDFVLDRGVNFSDFAVLASAWRSQKGDANWNRYCDISDPNDDVIDERDLDILTKYWLAGIQ